MTDTRTLEHSKLELVKKKQIKEITIL